MTTKILLVKSYSLDGQENGILDIMRQDEKGRSYELGEIFLAKPGRDLECFGVVARIWEREDNAEIYTNTLLGAIDSRDSKRLKKFHEYALQYAKQIAEERSELFEDQTMRNEEGKLAQIS
jgi:hypothetical protein